MKEFTLIEIKTSEQGKLKFGIDLIQDYLTGLRDYEVGGCYMMPHGKWIVDVIIDEVIPVIVKDNNNMRGVLIKCTQIN